MNTCVQVYTGLNPKPKFSSRPVSQNKTRVGWGRGRVTGEEVGFKFQQKRLRVESKKAKCTWKLGEPTLQEYVPGGTDSAGVCGWGNRLCRGM
jgi:hypothetical protein